MLTPSYLQSPNRMVSAANDVDYAFRELGDGAGPWSCSSIAAAISTTGPGADRCTRSTAAGDPVRQRQRRQFTGTTPTTVTQMAYDAIALIAMMNIDHLDRLGYSIGSLIAQDIALIRPALVRSMSPASSAPKGTAPGYTGELPR